MKNGTRSKRVALTVRKTPFVQICTKGVCFADGGQELPHSARWAAMVPKVSPSWVSTAAQKANSSSFRDPAMHTAKELIAVVRGSGSEQF